MAKVILSKFGVKKHP